MNRHHANYSTDQLSDTQEHRGRVLVDRRVQLREYHDGESLQGRGAAEGTNEEGRADQDEWQVECLFCVGLPDFLLVGIGIVGRFLDRLAECLKLVSYLRRFHPASQPA